MAFVGGLRGFLGYELKKMFHQSFRNITVLINRTLILYEKYFCLQFDKRAKRVSLKVVVKYLKLISYFLSLKYIKPFMEKEHKTCTCTNL